MTTAQDNTAPPDGRAATGITGLDEILRGGLPADRIYLVDGDPGTGKTTLAMQFLLEGHRCGEAGLYVTLSETEAELRAIAQSHGFDMSPIHVHALIAPETAALPENQYTVFHPSEVELGETTKAIMAAVDDLGPQRVVFDSLSEMRLLARDALRYRRQILALKQLFVGRGATVLLLDDCTAGDDDLQLHSLANGVIHLDQMAPDYGTSRRRLRVVKLRGVAFSEGYHDMTIERGGLRVYPRPALDERAPAAREVFASGVAELDTLFGGGLDRASTVLLLGPAGVGKSALATHYALAAAERGERAAVYLFDEAVDTYRWRAAGLGCDVEKHLSSGLLTLSSIDPATISPGEFAHRVQAAVDHGARIVVIDSLNGYMNAMQQERHLLLQMHDLFRFLRHRGVLTIAILAQQGLIGSMQSPVDLSYLADTVVLMRYFEADGSVRQAISVMKKRAGAHERTIREFRLDPRGLRLGEPLVGFRGVLTGVPAYTGGAAPLLAVRHDDGG
jgi:circadian clock protein KaiC